MKKLLKLGFVAFVVIVIMAALTFFVWSRFDYGPTNELNELVQEDQLMPTKHYYVIEPPDQPVKGGFILYPGAKVQPLAYAYYAQQLAKNGYVTAVVSFPFNMAFFSGNRAHQVINDIPNVEKWFIGGHSLGGVMAANYAYDNQANIDGVVFLASYPMNKNDFSTTDMPVLSIYGEKDGLTTPGKIKETKILLPKSATFIEIKGGNHAQFGLYGEQKGDKAATISAKKQQDQLVSETVKWLNRH
ncbi:alpha/beta fold hydrolase [Bacillus sp. CGMCC 1.16541]|uniref:alpha/beta fold hydrolase n=1 Tax=Bacillus sp. CGMCC 1.16541 TaxID=2185143 RepID=UPI000D730FB7|nr:alpha/beta fold hydrolase [Bacillus sp. CGMCC 1.16541]